MSIEVTSTSDSKEAVTAANNMADLAKQPEKKDDPKEPKEEIVEAPEESEEENIEEPEEEGEEELELKEEKPKKKGGFQKRIDKLSQRVSQAEENANYWRQEALRSKQPVEEQKAQPDSSKKPNPNDFKTADDYTEALIDWKADQKFLAKETEARTKAQQQETQTRIQKHQDRVKNFSESVDDWDEVIESVKVPLSITVQEAILESDVGPEIMYELAKNPDEFKRITNLSPISAAKAIGKLEAKLAKQEVPEKKTTTNVPKPVKTVRSNASPSLGYRDDMSQREYEAWRRQQSKNA